MEPITYYKSQSEKHKHTLRQYQKQRNFITITKILIFAIIVWQIYIAINDETPYFLYPLLVAIIAFIAMTRIDSKVVNHIRVTEALIRINEEENAYLQGELSPFPAGKEYGHPSHPYACDLDLFGDDSLFRHLDRTVTHEGQRQLAEWLLTPCLQRQEILRRQEAVRELTALPSWRQLFRANGKTQKIQEINTEKPLSMATGTTLLSPQEKNPPYPPLYQWMYHRNMGMYDSRHSPLSHSPASLLIATAGAFIPPQKNKPISQSFKYLHQ